MHFCFSYIYQLQNVIVRIPVRLFSCNFILIMGFKTYFGRQYIISLTPSLTLHNIISFSFCIQGFGNYHFSIDVPPYVMPLVLMIDIAAVLVNLNLMLLSLLNVY